MKLLKKIMDRSWEKLLVLCGALGVLLPVSPLNMQFTYSDSGVFLYTGWRILNGELPYRDIWDHKPPVVFYVNALGLAIADNSRWGVWLIELAALFLAAYIGFQLLKKTLGIFPALFSLLLWLISLVYVLQGGNLSTEYTLSLQFAALWLVYHADKTRRPHWVFFLIGLTGAIAFFMKQTAVGIWIAIVIYLTVQRLMSKQGRQWLGELSLISLGGLAISIIIAAFFSIQGAFPQFWSAAFEYNFIYSSFGDAGFTTRWASFINGIIPLTRTGLFQFSIIGYAAGLILILFRKSSIEKALPLLLVGLINLPIELILINIPRRTYPHYYMTLLPVLALFTGLAFWIFVSMGSTWKIPNMVKYALAFGSAGFLVWLSFNGYMNTLYTYRKLYDNKNMINYIKDNTTPNESVLLWGGETSMNYFTERKSPTRFTYQKPLLQEGYAREEFIIEFLDDVINNQPQLIIMTDTPTPMYEFPIHTEALATRIAYLQSHYCIVQEIDTWTIYKYTENGCESGL
ncbi:MAG: glycosyltransferase family 39 protein [Anaerolineales bacterium]|nr:glycosyltransferase family 39 protein [Anaerolineales bacterium]